MSTDYYSSELGTNRPGQEQKIRSRYYNEPDKGSVKGISEQELMAATVLTGYMMAAKEAQAKAGASKS